MAVEVLESKTGRIVVEPAEHGWTIIGGSRIWWQNDGVTPWGKFVAEIRQCDCSRPACKAFHAGRSCKSGCHELGHAERVHVFAERVLRTY